MRARGPVIIDTDCAIDDAIALVLLPAILVSAVGGILPAHRAAAGARRLLGGLRRGRPHAAAPRVCPGLDPPNDFMGVAPWAPAYRARCERMLDDIALPADAGVDVRCATMADPTPKAAPDAADAIIAAVRLHAGATLVCLGPLTNVAEAIDREPDLLSQLGELVVLGGAVRHAGAAPHGAEWNMWFDPASAAKVFAAAAAAGSAPLVLLANDVANDDAIDVHGPLVRALCEPVECDLACPPLAADALASLSLADPAEEAVDDKASRLRRQCLGRRLIALQPEALTMDPLASAFVLDPTIFEVEDAHVSVDPLTGFTAESVAGAGTSVRLAVRVDSSAYERLLRKELLDGVSS